MAHFLTADEKLTRAKVTGVILGFSGVVLLVGSDALGEVRVALIAQIACLAATLSYAFAGVYGRRFKAIGVSPMATATGQLIAASAILFPVAMIFDLPWRLPTPDTPVWLALAGLVLLSTALAYVLYFQLLARAGATNLLLVTFLIPVTAILLGSLILGEILMPNHIIGMAFIGAGLIAIDSRLPRRLWAVFRAPSAR